MPTSLTDVDIFPASITVPDDGDDRNAASVLIPFQQLADRTFHTKGKVDGYAGVAHAWTDTQTFVAQPLLSTSGGGVELGYDAVVTRTVMLPLIPFRASNWIAGLGSGSWVTATNDVFEAFVGRDYLPAGAVLSKVRAGVSVANPISLSVSRMSAGKAPIGPNVTIGSAVTDSFTPTGTQTHILEVSPGWTIDNVFGTILIDITPNTGGPTILYWIELQFIDPGPRNF